MKNILGGFLIFAGMMAVAGSVGDCDGKCMEYANTMEEMIDGYHNWVDIDGNWWYNNL